MRILQINRDVTERKRMEEDLRKINSRFKLAIGNSPVTVYELDHDLRITWISNPPLNFKEEDVLGNHLYKFIPPETAAELNKLRLDILESLTPGGREIPFPRDGETSYFLAYAEPLFDENGEVNGFRAVSIDITERKKAEKLIQESQRQLKSLSSQLLLAQEKERQRIAHELHDGLAADLAAIKYCLERELGAMPARSSSARIRIEEIVRHLQRVMEDVRGIMNNLHPSVLDDLGILPTIGWYCREMETVYDKIKVEKIIGLQENEVPKSLHVVIFRTLQEALNNVMKHSNASWVGISLISEDCFIRLAIEDNGRGFDFEKILSQPKKRGLGLSSMRERVELSEGNFRIDSCPGRGTTITARWLQTLDST